MSAYSLDLREKIVESVKKGVPKAETTRRFGVDRATVRRYCASFSMSAAPWSLLEGPSKRPKLDEKARKLLLEDFEERPWATHTQRAEFLYAACGVSVSEATICRTLRRLSHSRKKGPRGPKNETSS
jgi:transposase